MIGHRLFNGCALHFPVMHPDSGGGLCRPGVLGNGSCRNCGNPLAMLKRAFPRHTASNDLLKRHISTLSPIFHAASRIYPPPPSPASLLFFFSQFDPLSFLFLYVFYIFFVLKTSLRLLSSLSASALLLPADRHECEPLYESMSSPACQISTICHGLIRIHQDIPWL